jgi:hypothetical protein
VVELPWRAVLEADRNSRDFGGAVAHGAVTRRPPISLYTMVPRTKGHTYDVEVWDLSIVQGPFSVAPCPTLNATIRNLCVGCTAAGARGGAAGARRGDALRRARNHPGPERLPPPKPRQDRSLLRRRLQGEQLPNRIVRTLLKSNRGFEDPSEAFYGDDSTVSSGRAAMCVGQRPLEPTMPPQFFAV